jgi:head-tail adaptor
MNLGAFRNLITVENPGAPAPDGDGGFTLTYTAATQGQWWAAIQTATTRAAERIFAGTVTAHASYILNGRFHPEIGMQTRLSWTDRAGVRHVTNVLDVNDPQGSGVETVALVSEVAT